MIVISDATPLISLLKINRLNLLEKLFGEVVIPQAVYDELTRNPSFEAEANVIRKSVFVKSERITNESAVRILRNTASLDHGESEAIILAEELKAELLLLDEYKARRVAEQRKISVTGTLGVILEAFDEGLLTASDVRQCIEGLRQTKRWIGEALFAMVRQHIGP